MDIKTYATNIVPILKILARKQYADVKYWRNDTICYICNKNISLLTMGESRAHGINHLKERNLLPFI